MLAAWGGVGREGKLFSVTVERGQGSQEGLQPDCSWRPEIMLLPCPALPARCIPGLQGWSMWAKLPTAPVSLAIALALHFTFRNPVGAPYTSHLPRKPRPPSDNIFPELVKSLPSTLLELKSELEDTEGNKVAHLLLG